MAPTLKRSPLESHDDHQILQNGHHQHDQSSSSSSSSSTVFKMDGSDLLVNDHLILSEVPSNFKLTTIPHQNQGCFVGFRSTESKSRHVAHLGKLKNIRFMSIFCFKVWWSTLWVGNRGSDVQYETQFMILNKCDQTNRPFVLLIPLIEGPFRSSLQPSQSDHDDDDDHIDICVESGSNRVNSSVFQSCLYMQSSGNNSHCPFELVKGAFAFLRNHFGTFKLLSEKAPPDIVDKFGWCTWDAFYLKVTPQGVWDGVSTLAKGGCPPGFIIIDDGWKSMCHDDDDPMTESMGRNLGGQQVPCRLTNFLENQNFRSYISKTSPNVKGLGALVKDLKEEFRALDRVYAWHAFCGFWGGIRPVLHPIHPNMPESTMVNAVLSPSLTMTMQDGAVDGIVKSGVGLVPPEKAHQMFDGLHAHLSISGVDGVKLDVIHVMEMLGEEYGGRVELARAYFKAFNGSVKKWFGGNGVMASMQQCNDFMFIGTECISLGRVGDDFWSLETQSDPNGAYWLQGCHMVHCAYNSLWMGNFIHPDWDMFMSVHPCAAFHAASRAISGGPIYVSDAVGKHDFELLKRLVLPDGSVLRCEGYALPTRDCLFEDPLHDGKTLLKIWNLNKYTGVIGAFNCQGGGWDPKARTNKSAPQFSLPLTTTFSPTNIEWKLHSKNINEAQAFAVYMFQAKTLTLLHEPTQIIQLSLDPFTFELLTISPIKTFFVNKRLVSFVPIGLVNMFNTGGAVRSVSFDGEMGFVKVSVRGGGEMRVFASEKPKSCRVDGEEVEFSYDDGERMVVIHLHWCNSSVDYLF